MRWLAIVSLATLAACSARTPGPGPTSRTETLVVASSGGAVTQVTTVATDRPLAYPLTYTTDQVWRVMPAVFDSLGIPVTELDASRRRIGNAAFRLRRRLGGTPLQQYIDCGAAQGGPNAETYEVALTVFTEVVAGEAASSTVSTVVQANARPISFAGDWIRCTTKGRLEGKIAEIAAVKLQR